MMASSPGEIKIIMKFAIVCQGPYEAPRNVQHGLFSQNFNEAPRPTCVVINEAVP